MKIILEDDGATVCMRAETPKDLDFLYQMQGTHKSGVWGKAEFENIEADQLGFDHFGAGQQYTLAGKQAQVMAFVRLKTSWMGYAEPETQEFIDRKYAALRLGHSLIHGFELGFRDAQKPLNAG
jgi:hypothetical protein